MARASFQFSLQLFGAFQLERGGRAVHLPTRKFESLFAYLAFFPTCHAREKIAALFWGDSSDEQARASLRNALAVIRKLLGNAIILTDRENVQLHPAARLTVDAHEFQRALAARLGIADFKTTEFTQAQIDELESALALYQGDLLCDFYDDWIAPERERLRTLYLDALMKLSGWLRSRSQYARAIDFVRRALELEPTNEKAHQNLIFCHIAAGDRSAALKQYEECERILRDELKVEPLPETYSLYQWIVRSTPRSRTHEAQLTNLPVPLSEFIGREKDCAKLTQLLEQKRLVTLTGAAGCGKTRLAIQVAGNLIEQFKDGVWWIGLASVTAGTSLAQIIAGALGVNAVPDRSLLELLTNYLARKQMLLLFDCCDYHITQCAECIQILLSACPHLTILTTGREALNIAGETVWQIMPLETAMSNEHNASPEIIAELMRYDAVRLFVQRATLVKPDFGLNEKNAVAIGEICRHLDGIPLALELAAARVKALTVAQIAHRLNDRFHLLTAGNRTALPHHQTLKAAIDWSYDALSDAERIVFRRLSVFLNSWSIEAAEQVASDVVLDGTNSTIALADVLDLLTHLVTKSLVVVDSSGEDLRYRMLETVREYAHEKLIQAGELAVVQARYRAWSVQFAGNAELQC